MRIRGSCCAFGCGDSDAVRCPGIVLVRGLRGGQNEEPNSIAVAPCSWRGVGGFVRLSHGGWTGARRQRDSGREWQWHWHARAWVPGPGSWTGWAYVIRFNNSFFDGGVDIAALDGSPFTLVFYSDNSDGFDALADTVSPPGLLYPNIFSIAEIGPEGNNGAFYTPLPGQPGYVEEDGVVGVAGVTYHFVSDGTIPEPSSTALLALGLAILVLGVGQRQRTRRA